MNLQEITESLRASSAKAWQPVSGIGLLGLAIAAVFIVWQQYFTEGQWVFLLDSANLAIHEAGHPIVNVFSNRLMVYGGTIFQLMFPVAFAIHFWRLRQSLSWAVSLLWLGENLLNVGRYMADARAHVLPLVGGGEHDWTEIFLRWGVLASDTRIGGFTRFIGFCLMLYALLWVWRRWRGNLETPRRASRF